MTLGGKPHDFYRIASHSPYQEMVKEQAHETQAKQIPSGKPDSKNSKENCPPHNPEQVAHASDKKTGRQPSGIRRIQHMPGPRAKILLPKDPRQQRHADQRLNKERNPVFHAKQIFKQNRRVSTEVTEGNQGSSNMAGVGGKVRRNF